MPWVRLHGVKDYYGMALHLLEFPEMHCTINLVPSLLVQLLAYTDHGASDRFLDVSRVPADGLSEADALYLLDHFFMANPDHMIRPFPRYGELYQRRGLGATRPPRRCAASSRPTSATCKSGSTSPGSTHWPWSATTASAPSATRAVITPKTRRAIC